jgi:hypothetical protein
MTLHDGGEAIIEGGTISGGMPASTSGNAVLVVAKGSRLTLDGVTLETEKHTTGITLGTGTLITKNKTVIRNFTTVGVQARGPGNVIEMTDTTVEKIGQIGVLAAPGFFSVIDATITRTTFTGSRFGIQVIDGASKLAVTDSVFQQGEYGITIGTSMSVVVTGTKFTGLTSTGLQLAGLCKEAKVRGSSFTEIPAMAVGARLWCMAGSLVDFGTLAEAGGNTFAATLGTGVYVQGSAEIVNAVGNTWVPAQQAATDAGKYEVMGAGAVLEVTNGTGRNYQVVQGKLRLAQNP